MINRRNYVTQGWELCSLKYRLGKEWEKKKKVLQPERVPNPEDSESKNEEGNDRLEGTFWSTCERCEI